MKWVIHLGDLHQLSEKQKLRFAGGCVYPGAGKMEHTVEKVKMFPVFQDG